MKAIAIIPAAGLGTRMGKASADSAASERKQFIEIGGAPVLMHTLRRFFEAETISEIILAVRDADRELVEECLASEGAKKPIQLAPGGNNRQESVKNGLALAPADADVIAVHDAVRPFVTAELIDQAVRQAETDGAVILGVPAVDTVKRVDQKIVHATLPRERIMLAQTPQVFQAGLLRKAFARAEQDGFVGTDEASVVEHLGEDVHVMLGSERNIKITRPGDLSLAEFYLQEIARGA